MIIKKIKSACSIINHIGLYNFIIGYLYVIYFTILKSIFKFDEWHKSNPYHLRPYKKFAVDIINNLNPKTTIEIGCGLGEMLVRIKGNTKIGIDPSAAVINSNKFIHPFSNTKWLVGDTNTINDLKIKDIDVIFMIGWTHEVNPEDLKNLLMSICNKTKFLVLDKFIKDINQESYLHNFTYLDEYMDLISEHTPENDDIRSYFIYKKK
jgi:SAM-dependent methyltransferase